MAINLRDILEVTIDLRCRHGWRNPFHFHDLRGIPTLQAHSFCPECAPGGVVTLALPGGLVVMPGAPSGDTALRQARDIIDAEALARALSTIQAAVELVNKDKDGDG